MDDLTTRVATPAIAVQKKRKQMDSFSAGLFVGSLVGFLLVFLVEITTDNQADYWRNAYCLDARNPAEFCAANEQYQEYLDTMIRVRDLMQGVSADE